MINRKEIYLAVACFFAGVTLIGAYNGCLFTETPEAPGIIQTAPGFLAQTGPPYPHTAGYNPGVYWYTYPLTYPAPGTAWGYRGHAGTWDPKLIYPLPGDPIKTSGPNIGVGQ